MAKDFASNKSLIDVGEASILPEWTIEWAIKQGMSAADADYLASCCPTTLTAFERRVLGLFLDWMQERQVDVADVDALVADTEQD